MAKPAARITDSTSCPVPGHGAKAVASGSPDVFFDGLAAARQGDTCTCGSTLASDVSATVFINGKNAALVGTTGTHGDVVIGGSGTVIIGDSHTPAPFIPIPPLNINKAPYSGRFQLIDQATGKPVAGRKVKVWSSDGWSAVSITDAQGMTSWVNHDTPASIHIDLVQEDEA